MNFQLNQYTLGLLYDMEDIFPNTYHCEHEENDSMCVLLDLGLVRMQGISTFLLTKKGGDFLNWIDLLRNKIQDAQAKPKRTTVSGKLFSATIGTTKGAWQTDPASTRQKAYINALATQHPSKYEEATKILTMNEPGWDWGTLTKGQAGILIGHMKGEK